MAEMAADEKAVVKAAAVTVGEVTMVDVARQTAVGMMVV